MKRVVLQTTKLRSEMPKLNLRKEPPNPPKKPSSSGFGEVFTPNVLQLDWTALSGWSKPRFARQIDGIHMPYSASSLHYAISCFEGTKAYAADSGKALLFRPDINARRFAKSCRRLALPTIQPEEFVRLIRLAIRRDLNWIPHTKDAALYIRPTMISTDRSLRIAPPKSAKFFILLSPVSGYFKQNTKEATLLIERGTMRAWPGGTGALKLACNYAPTILPLKRAHRKKCIQNLWLGPNDECTEAGSMNIFFVFKCKRSGKRNVYTPPLDDMVLPGVIRSSVLTLLRSMDVVVRVESVSLSELLEGITCGNLVECFGCGTAATITPINAFRCDNRKYTLPEVRDGLATKLLGKLRAIQYGRIVSRWAISV
ncbi:branched-chain amino acid aminotransferase family protein [Perkinsela sp. CCAP 1560/4]|nr:branched-chain amino acid aminotransferase family protein [Perkinsela sp. CCAP 1560/4]|eukprot:KNH04666.1 branched-chain amino acid aminotransferase family protein [Perkinsela sp. CCAP 1560/4]